MKMFNTILGGMLLCTHLSFAQAYETDLFALLDNADKGGDQAGSVVNADFSEIELTASEQFTEEKADNEQGQSVVVQENFDNITEETNFEPSDLASGINAYDMGD